MLLHKALIKTLFVFAGSFLIINVLFAILYYFFYSGTDISFYDWLFYSISAFTTFGFKEIAINDDMEVLIVLHLFVSSLILPILTALVFYYILNRPPNIIFSKKLIIRERNTNPYLGDLALCAKVANKSKSKLYGVRLTLFFERFQPKEQSNILVRNGVENFTEEIEFLDITHRFQFPLESLSYSSLKPLLNNSVTKSYDIITAVISGKSGKFGEDFIHEYTYVYSDIIFSPNLFKMITYIDGRGKKFGTKVEWDNLHISHQYTAKELATIEKKLKKLVEEKENDKNI